MKKNELCPDDKALVEAELNCLAHVTRTLESAAKAKRAERVEDDELVALRDQLGETRAEDHAMLVEHMTRISALRRTKQGMNKETINLEKPYFGHLQLKQIYLYIFRKNS